MVDLENCDETKDNILDYDVIDEAESISTPLQCLKNCVIILPKTFNLKMWKVNSIDILNTLFLSGRLSLL